MAAQLLAAAGLVLAGCGGDDPDAAVSTADVPPTINDTTVIAASPAGILVVGGEGAGHTTEIGLYDPDAGTWSAMADAPFSAALFSPAVSWTGTAFLIVGTLCSEASFDDSGVSCSPGGVAAAIYDPEANSWSEAEAPKVTGEVAGQYIDSYNEDYSALVAPDGLHIFDHDSKQWRSVPRPFDDQYTACVVGDEVLALNGRLSAPRARALTIATGEWADVIDSDVDVPLQAWGFACGQNGVWALSIDQNQTNPPAVEFTSAHRFENRPHPGNALSDSAFDARSARSTVVANQGGQVALFDAESATWSQVQVLKASSIGAVVLSNHQVFVTAFSSADPDGEIRQVEVAR